MNNIVPLFELAVVFTSADGKRQEAFNPMTNPSVPEWASTYTVTVAFNQQP